MPKLYEALAEAFLAEGIDTQFVLMGDGNMHWCTAFAKLPGVHTVHVRHEHATVAAATAYNVATGKIAVASVTCGPGVTQLMTALPAAVRARLPMVVFAGESPINARFYNQAIDQAPLVTSTGAKYIAAHSLPRMMDYVREAFHVAKVERCPVVLGVPYDLQKVEYMANQPYETSAMYQPKVGRMHPDPEVVAEAVERLAAAKRPIILGGRGVLWSGSRDAMIKLAEKYGDRPPPELPLLFQRILQNATHDYFRRQKVRNTWVSLFSSFGNADDDEFDPLETFESQDGTVGAESSESRLEREQVLNLIDAEIQKLPARQREAFLMRYWEDMDVAETAAAMGCSEGSVKTHCSRATHALAHALKAKGITL